MSTHFRPRPHTSGPPSPSRPSTARSTIRAIAPSPPPSLSDALRLDLASTGTPKLDSQSTTGSARVRPKSDVFHQTHMHGFGEEELEFANYVATAEDGNFDSSPADITANVTIKRGCGAMGRRPPVKHNSRSNSPKKRPYSTPTELSFHHLSPSRGHDLEQTASLHEKQVQVESDRDANYDCPDTPTPMTNSQKRSAYLPLGTPTAFPNSKRSSKSKSRSGPRTPTSATTTPTSPTPKLEFFESFDEQSAYNPRDVDAVHRQTYPREGEHDIHPRMHLAPPQHTVDTPLRKAVTGATSNVQRQVSVSEVSHFSGGTVSSKQSVFSTPGRDEMERKKTLVEDDEGPFAKAVSMADLDERRRVVSEQRAGDDRRAAILETEGSQKRRKYRACGWKVGCNMM